MWIKNCCGEFSFTTDGQYNYNLSNDLKKNKKSNKLKNKREATTKKKTVKSFGEKKVKREQKISARILCDKLLEKKRKSYFIRREQWLRYINGLQRKEENNKKEKTHQTTVIEMWSPSFLLNIWRVEKEKNSTNGRQMWHECCTCGIVYLSIVDFIESDFFLFIHIKDCSFPYYIV